MEAWCLDAVALVRRLSLHTDQMRFFGETALALEGATTTGTSDIVLEAIVICIVKHFDFLFNGGADHKKDITTAISEATVRKFTVSAHRPYNYSYVSVAPSASSVSLPSRI